MRVLTIGGLVLAAGMMAGTAMADTAPPAPAAPAALGVAESLGFPSPVEMFGGGDPDPNRTQDVTAEYLLSNLTNQPVTLTADSDCASHTWTVTDPTGAVVEQSLPCPAGGTPVTLVVPQGKPTSGQSIVTLHVFDYKADTTYTIHYKAFGAGATGDFQVTLLK
ncbi:MAG TPA: hypothetical protein VHU87_11230 [Rhizomicrobium sp.]|jgi:hypothetical protein|nr:hypothetical protein [Rhizomicrobium sp.]